MTDQAKKYKGVVELEVCGEHVGFKFGLATTKRNCELEGLKCDADGLEELGKRLAAQNPTTYLNFYYAAAVSYAKLFNKPEPSFDQVCNWVDNLETSQSEEALKTAFLQPNDPNQPALQKEGQSTV